MADRFTLEQSKRLFGVIAAGGTAGAIAGSWLAVVLAERIGTPALLLIAAGFLVIGVLAAWLVTRLRPEGARGPADAGAEDRAIGGSAWEGFRAGVRPPHLPRSSAGGLKLAGPGTCASCARLHMG